MEEKICRLCLQTSENYKELGGTLSNILKLNLGITKETRTCIECTNNLEILFDLKSACEDMRARVLSLGNSKNAVSLDPVKIEDDLKPVIELKDKIQCSFCTKSTEKEDLVLLHESKENIFVVDVLEKHIPELNLSNIRELLSCKTCLDGMKSISSFLTKCMDVEEKISKYIEVKGTDDKGQVELKDVQQFTFKPMVKFEAESCQGNELRQSYDCIQEEFLVKAEDEPFIKTEDVDIKSEQSDCESSQEPPAKIKLGNEHETSSVVYKCDTCTNEATCRKCLHSHMFTHQSLSERKIFKCEMCEYEAKRKYALKTHMLIHKSPSELIMYKCNTCAYESKHKRLLNRHKLIHKDPSEITTLRCDMCTYETKHKRNLNSHVLFVHTCPSGTTMYKCETCTYETRHKQYLKQHKLTHKDPSERTTFKCGLCTVEVKRKRDLNRHVLFVHKNPSETKMYKCGSCTYETNYEQNLNRHQLCHKSSSNVMMYKCNTCTYQTKSKAHLKDHNLIHMSPSEITMFKCEMCAFESKRERNVRKHMLTHKNSSEVTKIKCKICAFETIHKYDLRRHMLVHERNLTDDRVHNR